MEQILLPLGIGCAAQLWANHHHGRGQSPVQLILLLSFGMPALLALACVHAANLTQSGLAALLHARLGNVHVAGRWCLMAAALPAAAVALLLLLALPTNAQAAVLILCIIIAALLTHRARTGPNMTRASLANAEHAAYAGLLLASAASGSTLLRNATAAASDRQREGTAAATIFMINLLIACALCWWLQTVPLLHLLGLLTGAVLAAHVRMELWRQEGARTVPPVDY